MTSSPALSILYTAALIASLALVRVTVHRAPLRQIGGAPPDPARLQEGCPFRLRCASADEPLRPAKNRR